jgi:hypothetical protein
MFAAMTGGSELVLVDGDREESADEISDVFPYSTSTSDDKKDEVKAGSW